MKLFLAILISFSVSAMANDLNCTVKQLSTGQVVSSGKIENGVNPILKAPGARTVWVSDKFGYELSVALMDDVGVLAEASTKTTPSSDAKSVSLKVKTYDVEASCERN